MKNLKKKNQNPGTYGCINFHTAIIDKFFKFFYSPVYNTSNLQ